MVLTREGPLLTLSIPRHGEIGRGLLRDQIRKAGVSVEEFIAALH